MASNKHIEYKDFFSVTDFIQAERVEMTYRKVFISEETLHKETENSIVSFEIINASKALGIYNYLKYKLPELTDEEDRKWYQKNIKFFDTILSNIESDKTFITPTNAFINHHYVKISYDDLGEEHLLGRLYGKNSIQSLPREIRYHLFHGKYHDFDIANAHPSILFSYSKKHNLKLSGALQRYIENREKTTKIILDEWNSSSKKKLDSQGVKSQVLKTLNRTWKNGPSEKKSKTLALLDKDFTKIREHLWEKKTSQKTYKKAVYAAYKKKSLGENPEGKEDVFEAERLMKVSLQSFFCQDQETFYLLDLTGFLRKKYSSLLCDKNKNRFEDFFPYTDKKVNLPATYTLSIVPFFDGMYIYSPFEEFNAKLDSFVEEYNTKHEYISFVRKDIKENISHITDREEFEKYLIISKWLSNNESKTHIELLLKKTGITDSITSLTKLLPKKNNFKSQEIYFKTWDELYKKKISEIKREVFKPLLRQNIKTDRDIVDVIKSL